MTELYELPTPAAGRVGVCRNAIDEALKLGFSLRDCASRLGLNYKTFWQAYRANKIAVPPEKQLPLPVPVAPEEKCFRPAHNSNKEPKEAEVQEEPRPKKALARVTGSQKPESEMSVAERIIANIPHI